MFIEIKPMEDFEFNCFSGSIASIITTLNYDFKLAYAKGWDFTVLSPLPSISDCYNLLGKSSISENDILNYSNMRLHGFNDKTFDDIISIMKKELAEGKPVLVGIDVIVCPWFIEAYKVSHAPHCIIITGFDDDSIYCTDVSKMISKGKIPYSEFKIGLLGTALTLSKKETDSHSPSKSDYLISIIESSERMQGLHDNQDRFDEMKYFSEKFKDFYSMAREEAETFGDKNFAGTKLFAHIINVLQDRSHFSYLLNSIGQEFNEDSLISISKTMESICEDWKIIKNLLLKAHSMNGDINLLDRISNIIINNREREQEIARDIIRSVKISS